MSAEERGVVIDASLAAKWIFHEEQSDSALRLRETWQENKTFLHAPDFLLVELHNVLWKKLQRGLLPPDAPVIGMIPSLGLDLNWSPTPALLAGAFLLACQKKISVYDGIYVALGQVLGAPLYTADQVLAQKLQNSAIAVHAVS